MITSSLKTCGIPLPLPITEAAAAQELLRAVVVDADGEVWLGHPHVGLGAQAHIAEEVGGVAAIRPLPAQDDVEADGETGEIAGAGAGTEQHDLVELEPQQLEQALGLRRASAGPRRGRAAR